VRLADDYEIVARTVLLAKGADYRLPVDGLTEYEGLSVFTRRARPGQLCGASHVAGVGDGNSAGEAAVWLARGGALVTLLHRAAPCARRCRHTWCASSSYGVAVRDRSEIAALHGRSVTSPPSR
jgi:thioredoxin reductase